MTNTNNATIMPDERHRILAEYDFYSRGDTRRGALLAKPRWIAPMRTFRALHAWSPHAAVRARYGVDQPALPKRSFGHGVNTGSCADR